MEQRGSLTVENVPEPDADTMKDLSSYQNTRHCVFRGFLPGAGVLITTRFANSAQVHHVKVPMGARKQITYLAEPVKSCAPAPAGCVAQGFIYGCDRGGDEQTQFWFQNMETGRAIRLTDGKSVNKSVEWSDCGKRVAFSSNARDGKHFDVYVTEIAHVLASQDGEAPRVPIMRQDKPGYLFTSGFVDDHVLVQHYVSVSDSTLYLLDAAKPNAPPLKVAPTGGEAAVGAGRLWVVGGVLKGVLFASNEQRDFMTLRYFDLSTGTSCEVVSESEMAWDVEHIAASGDAKNTVVVYNVDGCSQAFILRARDPASGPAGLRTELKLAFTGVIDVLQLDSAGTTLGISAISANAPTDTFTLDLASAAPPVRWTEAEVGGLNPLRFVTPSLVRFPSFDNRSISALVYFPPGEGQARAPVIIHPHGGPEGQHRARFSPMIQFLVLELGVCVIDPNVRGSDGYGKEFVNLDNGKNREDSVKDMGAVMDWVEQSPRLDSSRIAVWGGSYGGYMVLAGLVHYSDRLVCGIDMVGISNFVTFLENTSDYRRDLRRVKYGDERDPEMRAFLLSISPLTNAHKIRRPLLIVQGANDPRVPQSEARQIRDKVVENGEEVWYMVAADEGHGFAKKSNVDAYQAALVAFCKKHLLPAAEVNDLTITNNLTIKSEQGEPQAKKPRT